MSHTPRATLFGTLLAASIVSCAPLRAPGVAAAVAPGPLPRLEGTWSLIAADEIQTDGTRTQSYGPHPKGLLIIDAAGRYSLQLFRSGRLKYATGDKRRGTPEEYVDTVLGMSSHTGTCFVDPGSGLLVFQIELAQFPNWEGTVQRRTYTLSGDTLRYRIPVSASGNGTIPISEWVRLR